MESNSKKSFVASEVIRRQGFCGDTIKAIKAAGVTEVVVNAEGRLVVRWGDRLVMWDAPATVPGRIAAQKAIVAAGMTLTGRGVLTEALKGGKPVAEKSTPKPAMDEPKELKEAVVAEAVAVEPEKKEKVKRTPRVRAPKAK